MYIEICETLAFRNLISLVKNVMKKVVPGCHVVRIHRRADAWCLRLHLLATTVSGSPSYPVYVTLF